MSMLGYMPKTSSIRSSVLVEHQLVTDRRTDIQVYAATANTALA